MGPCHHALTEENSSQGLFAISFALINSDAGTWEIRKAAKKLCVLPTWTCCFRKQVNFQERHWKPETTCQLICWTVPGNHAMDQPLDEVTMVTS